MKDFASQIYAAVRTGQLREPFSPDDVRRACPGWAPKTYNVFLAKHRVGNPGKMTELLERVARGRFRTLPSLKLKLGHTNAPLQLRNPKAEDEIIPGHKFYVGQIVQISAAPNRPGGSCEIIRLLPAELGEPKYEVKLACEPYERITRESELYESSP